MEINLTEVIGKKFSFFQHNNHYKLIDKYNQYVKSNDNKPEISFPVFCFNEFILIQSQLDESCKDNMNVFYNQMSLIDIAKQFPIK